MSILKDEAQQLEIERKYSQVSNQLCTIAMLLAQFFSLGSWDNSRVVDVDMFEIRRLARDDELAIPPAIMKKYSLVEIPTAVHGTHVC
jgi:hypothetical protein